MSLRTGKAKPLPLPRSRLDEVLRAGVDAGFCGGAPAMDLLGISKFASLSLKTDAGNQGGNQGQEHSILDGLAMNEGANEDLDEIDARQIQNQEKAKRRVIRNVRNQNRDNNENNANEPDNGGGKQEHDPTWMDFMDDCDEYFREVEGEDDKAREARTQRLLDCMRRAIEKERILQRQNHPPPISPSQRVHMWHAPRVDVKDRRPRWNYRNNPDEYDPEEYERDYP